MLPEMLFDYLWRRRADTSRSYKGVTNHLELTTSSLDSRMFR